MRKNCETGKGKRLGKILRKEKRLAISEAREIRNGLGIKRKRSVGTGGKKREGGKQLGKDKNEERNREEGGEREKCRKREKKKRYIWRKWKER